MKHFNTLQTYTEISEKTPQNQALEACIKNKGRRIANILAKKLEKNNISHKPPFKKAGRNKKPEIKSYLKEYYDEINENNIEKTYTFDEYERINENLNAEDGFTDFVNIIAEGHSIAGTYLQEAFYNFEWEITFENAIKILKKADEDVEEYDEEAKQGIAFYDRVADYSYSIDKDSQVINLAYSTCRHTNIEAKIDFLNNSSIVTVSGKFPSVMRRIDATGAGNEYHTRFSDIIPPFYVHAKSTFDSLLINHKYKDHFYLHYDEGVNLWESQKYKSNTKDIFHQLGFPKQRVILGMDYEAFYEYGIALGLSEKRFFEIYNSINEEYNSIMVEPEENIQEKFQEYINKVTLLLNKIEQIASQENNQ